MAMTFDTMITEREALFVAIMAGVVVVLLLTMRLSDWLDARRKARPRRRRGRLLDHNPPPPADADPGSTPAPPPKR